MLMKDRQKPAMILGGAGAVLLLLAIVVFLSRPSLRRRRGGGAHGGAKAARPRRDPLRRPQSLPAGARAQPGHGLLGQRGAARLDRRPAASTGAPNMPATARSGPGSSSPTTSRRWRCSSSARRPANMSSPATCSTRQAMARVRGAPPRRRRQGLHRRHRGAHHPRRPAARDRRGPAAPAQRAAGLRLRESRGGPSARP